MERRLSQLIWNALKACLGETKLARTRMVMLVLLTTAAASMSAVVGGQEPATTPAAVAAATNIDTTSGVKIDWLARGLSPKTVQIPSIGLSLHLPVDSGYSQKPQTVRRLEAWANDKSWLAAIDVQQTSNPEVTLATIAAETIATNDRQSLYFSVPIRASLVINGEPAERLVMKLRPRKGQEEVHAMYTIFQPMPQTFVIHKIWTKVSDATEVLKIQRMVVDSFRFADPAALVEIRRHEVGRMSKIVEGMAREDYERLILPSRWYRIYRYNKIESDGEGRGANSSVNRRVEGIAQEVAYYRIEERVGMLGEVNRSALRNTFSGAERKEGLLVTLMSRYLLLEDGSAYVDLESTAWMSFDREQERWSIRSASYVKDAHLGQYLLAERRTLTGDRRGDLMQIVRDFPPAAVETAQLRVPRESYINQAEQHLIYRMLLPFEAATFGMYLYEPRLGRIAYRTEALTPGNLTRSESKRQKDADPHVVTLNSAGTITRMEMVNGDITVPIQPEDLLSIWKANNLPTSKGSSKPTSPRLSNPVTEGRGSRNSDGRRR